MIYILKLKTEEVLYDTSYGFVIRAKNSKHARKLASSSCYLAEKDSWLDSSKTSCRILKSTGSFCVILRDYNAG